MTLMLDDILLMLDIVQSYTTKKPASHKYVKNSFGDQPIKKAQIRNYDVIEQLCIQMNLLLIEDDIINITPLGKKILKHHISHDRNIIDEFINNVILNHSSDLKIRLLLAKFYIDKNDTYYYPKKEIYNLFSPSEVLPIMYEIGLLVKKNDKVIINPKYSKLLIKKITQKDLEEKLQRKKEIGAIGEKIVLEFERNRLKNMGCVNEASHIHLISSEYTNAGYDIESFDKGKDGKIHKIYIEVKSSASNKIDFYWSSNEIKVAHKYSDRYWIYFVPSVNIQTKKSSKDPIRLQNPHKMAFINTSLNAKPSEYHVIEGEACENR